MAEKFHTAGGACNADHAHGSRDPSAVAVYAVVRKYGGGIHHYGTGKDSGSDDYSDTGKFLLRYFRRIASGIRLCISDSPVYQGGNGEAVSQIFFICKQKEKTRLEKEKKTWILSQLEQVLQQSQV